MFGMEFVGFGSLWQDAENRSHLLEEFERRNSQVVVIPDFDG